MQLRDGMIQVPYGPFELSRPVVFHYGQAIFGEYAYLNKDEEAVVFRPFMNIKRLNRSAARLCIPQLDEDLVWEGLRKLLTIEKTGFKTGHPYISVPLLSQPIPTGVCVLPIPTSSL